MGDIGNWEFAAAVAAVTLGLGGLLLFTAIATVGAWRIFGAASDAAAEAARTTEAVQELGRQLALEALRKDQDDAPEVTELRRRVDLLMEQQARLQETLRGVADAAPGHAAGEQHVRDLETAVRRLEEMVSEIAIAVADLNQRLA